MSSLKSVLILQLLLPMLAVGLFWLLGLPAAPLAVALVGWSLRLAR